MIKLWAEKEVRNLKRLRSAGILCPEPLLLKQHVVVMGFLGIDGFPAPQLGQVKADRETFQELCDLSPYMFSLFKIVFFINNFYIDFEDIGNAWRSYGACITEATSCTRTLAPVTCSSTTTNFTSSTWPRSSSFLIII